MVIWLEFTMIHQTEMCVDFMWFRNDVPIPTIVYSDVGQGHCWSTIQQENCGDHILSWFGAKKKWFVWMETGGTNNIQYPIPSMMLLPLPTLLDNFGSLTMVKCRNTLHGISGKASMAEKPVLNWKTNRFKKIWSLEGCKYPQSFFPKALGIQFDNIHNSHAATENMEGVFLEAKVSKNRPADYFLGN